MGIATGVVDTEAVLADEKVVDMDEEFKLLDPEESQFYTILDKVPSKPAIREKVNWLEDSYFPRQTKVAAAGYLVGDAAFPASVSTGAFFRKGDLVRNLRTMEMMEVTADPAADTVAVARAIGSVAAAAGDANDELIIVSNVSAQNSDVGTLKVTTRILGYNYTQIVRHPFGYSGTDVEIETYGVGDPLNEIGKKAVEHKRSLESLLVLGARKFTAASPNSKGYMGGVVEYLSTNVFSSIGALTRSTLDDKMIAIFQHGSRNKVILSAPLPAARLSGLLADNWIHAQPGENVYGAKVSGFITGSYGDRVPVITKREWGTFSAASNGLGSWMLVLDLDYIAKRPMRNRGTVLLRNRQGNGVDGVVHEYRTELSLEIAQESAHGLLKGIS